MGIGLFIIGIAITGSAAYSETQSTSYLVQVDKTVSGTDESVVSYSGLTDTEKEVFDRIKNGGAAPAKDFTLTTFANNAVQYQGEVYTFRVTYDPVTLTIPLFVLGVVVSVSGGVLFFLISFITEWDPRRDILPS
ncbi:hypothetical protein GCM10022627_37070 [Haloarcula argentinensis]